MSRYNSLDSQLAKPFYDLFFLLVITPPLIALFLLYLGIYGPEEAEEKLSRHILCRITSHNWADEEKYGVEPVCIHCGQRR